MTTQAIKQRLFWLIFYAWSIPPFFGLGFILLIGILSPEHILGIITTPLEPIFIIGWLIFALWFLPKQVQPLFEYLDAKPGSNQESAQQAIAKFPFTFWMTFLVYLFLAPIVVILAAEQYTSYIAAPYDWFRISLVALIVSIIVGLPIFFLIFDLFGKALGGMKLSRPILSIRTKVFLIGALTPLLIGTMLVQYYWTRTDFFTFETFGIWLFLELIAIGGSLIFAQSFGQSLTPLQSFFNATHPMPSASIKALKGASTDEIGILTGDYRALLLEQLEQQQMLEEANNLLRISSIAFDVNVGMVVTDANGIIIQVNKAYTDITGFNATEKIGHTVNTFDPDYHEKEFYEQIQTALATDGRWEGELWDERKNKEMFPLWLRITAVFNEDKVITHYVLSYQDMTTHKDAEIQIRNLAFFDQLTGLANRTLLQEHITQEMASTILRENYNALLLMDLDNFKTLNDSHGHAVGDLLLKEVSKRIQSCVKKGDTLARFGGDEFILALYNLSTSQLEAATSVELIAQRILNIISQPYHLGTISHSISASIGITFFKGDEVSFEDLIKQADLAMYKAKENGRNNIFFFDPGLESIAKERITLENELRNAISKEHFELYYQPQIRSEQFVGAEALIRWQHPQQGIISPAKFIPLAEESDLILPLGDWILKTACQQLSQWATDPALKHLTLAVNVSAQQFHQKNFVDRLKYHLDKTGANPERLKLELTESMLVKDVDLSIARMFEIKGLGITFSLDDFGTGYSSLTYLKNLPLDELKIDQSFVQDVLSDVSHSAITKTIVNFAHNLNMEVIAEGVETSEQRDFLSNIGCHNYQGYFFSRPLAINDFKKFRY
jgi:diguanylate cyclase (GGDEF)-like protein/PAS domain S-box-containing protein